MDIKGALEYLAEQAVTASNVEQFHDSGERVHFVLGNERFAEEPKELLLQVSRIKVKAKDEHNLDIDVSGLDSGSSCSSVLVTCGTDQAPVRITGPACWLVLVDNIRSNNDV